MEKAQMFEFFQNLMLANPLEFYTAVIATLGVALWAVDRKSMKAALNAARGSEKTAHRLERLKADANFERNFLAFQLTCQARRDAWNMHNFRRAPMLSSGLHVSQEQKEILLVEREGRSLFDQLKASAPNLDCSEIAKLETYVIAADRSSLEITRLASRLPEPGSFRH
jgi:hypothetical protein